MICDGPTVFSLERGMLPRVQPRVRLGGENIVLSTVFLRIEECNDGQIVGRVKHTFIIQDEVENGADF